jgi:hypothetical protein
MPATEGSKAMSTGMETRNSSNEMAKPMDQNLLAAPGPDPGMMAMTNTPTKGRKVRILRMGTPVRLIDDSL